MKNLTIEELENLYIEIKTLPLYFDRTEGLGYIKYITQEQINKIAQVIEELGNRKENESRTN